MGVLGCSRGMMKKVIEKSYTTGQYYGEMKKIKDSRRQKLIEKVSLTKTEKSKIDAIFLENYGKKVKYDWHRLYQSFTGNFDEKYFPEYLFSSALEAKMNPDEYRYVLDDKLFLHLFIKGILNARIPYTYFTVANGICFDEFRNIIPLEQIDREISVGAEVIVKPTQDTSSGVGVEKIRVDNLKNVIRNKMMSRGIYVVQECVKQNDQLRKLYPNSVNTFRVITYLWKGKIYHIPLALRIGQGGNYLDNAHAGGMFIGVDDNGELKREAFTEFGKRYKAHPDTKIQFQGYRFDFIPDLIATAKKLHLNAPQLGIISWDITVDQDGVFVLIEANTRGQSVWFPQMANGKGAFGENTEEILQFISKK